MGDTTKSPPWSLTAHLLSLTPHEYETATQAPFLLAAAEGRLPKPILSRWLANDRLYIHGYIRAAATLLAGLELPQAVIVPGPPQLDAQASIVGGGGGGSGSGSGESVETQLADWLIEALVGVRREERFFVEVAARYGLTVDLTVPMPPLVPATGDDGDHGAKNDGDDCAAGGVPSDFSSLSSSRTRHIVPEQAKLPGLVLMERIFASLVLPAAMTTGSIPVSVSSATPPLLLPWLEAAVTFWGTERCYLDAWSWAKARQSLVAPTDCGDADGGALRNEFIPNWSSPEFASFVARLGTIIDSAVAEAVAHLGDPAKEAILARVETRWRSLLLAEATFWPDVILTS